MESRDKQVAELVVGMRTPLSRVELAATQLARTLTTPAARELAAGISDAVSQLDERISDALAALERDAADVLDCTAVLPALRRRMEPVLRARSVEWSSPGESGEPVYGDRVLVAKSALALLAAGMELAGSPGRLSLEMIDGGAERYGVWLRVRCGDQSALERVTEGGEADRCLSRARAIASDGGGALELEAQPGEDKLTLWLRRAEENRCDA